MGRNPWGENDEIGTPQVAFVMSPVDGTGTQHHGGIRAQVGADHLCGTGGHGELGGPLAGASHAKHHHTGVRDSMDARTAHQRTLRVERATRASRMLMIQNRTMIFGSLHPSFS